MDTFFYLNKFKEVANRLDRKLLDKKNVEASVVMYMDSVVLKLYKSSWANKLPDPLTAESRIFFSVWINDAAIKEQKILYNIHALKLRKLKGYFIESRKFAESFRHSFKDFEHKWKNVSVHFGPLTLMGGWLKIDPGNFQDEMLTLANNFLEIEHLIDDTLSHFKKVPQ